MQAKPAAGSAALPQLLARGNACIDPLGPMADNCTPLECRLEQRMTKFAQVLGRPSNPQVLAYTASVRTRSGLSLHNKLTEASRFLLVATWRLSRLPKIGDQEGRWRLFHFRPSSRSGIHGTVVSVDRSSDCACASAPAVGDVTGGRWRNERLRERIGR